MNVITIETDLLSRLSEQAKDVLRSRALREGRPLIDVVRDVINEAASRVTDSAPTPPPVVPQMAA